MNDHLFQLLGHLSKLEQYVGQQGTSINVNHVSARLQTAIGMVETAIQAQPETVPAGSLSREEVWLEMAKMIHRHHGNAHYVSALADEFLVEFERRFRRVPNETTIPSM